MHPYHPVCGATPGHIDWNEKWPKTPKTTAALQRLEELGVIIESDESIPQVNFVLRISRVNVAKYAPEELVEVGYLMSQPGNTDFPEDFAPPWKQIPPAPISIFHPRHSSSAPLFYTIRSELEHGDPYVRYVVVLKEPTKTA